jgi:hypothetical protein
MQSAKSGVSRLSAYLPMWPHASGMPQAGCQALSRSDRDTKVPFTNLVSIKSVSKEPIMANQSDLVSNH